MKNLLSSLSENITGTELTAKRVFTRDATGLVRELSPFHAFVTTLQVTGIPTGIATMIPFVPFVWPGANQALALVLVLPILLIHSTLYILLSWSMPRSGGDYVWTGRIIHPSLASSLNFTFVIFGAIAVGTYGTFIISYGFLSLFVSAGVIINNINLINYTSAVLTNPFWELVYGTFFMLYVLFLMIISLRSYVKQQLVLWLVGLVGTLLAMGLLVGVTPTVFAASFNKYLGSYSTYDQIIATAKTNGFSWAPSMSASIACITFAWLINNGYQYSGYIAGELKNLKTSMIYSTLGNNIFSTIVYALFAYLFVTAVGDNWWHSLAFLSYGLPSSYTLPIPPNPYFFVSLLTNNIWLAFIINLAIIAGAITVIASFDIALTRIVMAMAFDRILPTKLSEVSDRFHTPVYATLLVFAFCYIGTVGLLFLGPIFAFLNFTLMYTIALAIGGITGAVFPYLKKTKPLYERSPIAHLRVGGMPLVTITGILTFITMSYLAYAAGLNPVIGGTNNPIALGVLLFVFIASGSLYFIAKAYHKSKGLDITVAFHELPPE